MRIAVISDTHANDHRKPSLKSQADEIFASPPQVLVHLGDIGESEKSREWQLNLYSCLNSVKIVVPGNHDLWVTGPHANSPRHVLKHYNLIRGQAVAAGWHWLPDGPVVPSGGSVSFVGRMGGFDGSLGGNSDQWQMQQLWYSTIDGMLTRYPLPSAVRNPWDWQREEFRLLKRDIKYSCSMDGVKTIVLVTHYPMSSSLRHPTIPEDHISFMFGNEWYTRLKSTHLGRFARDGGNVWLLAGHTHGEVKWVDPDPDVSGRVKAMVSGSDYGRPLTYFIDL